MDGHSAMIDMEKLAASSIRMPSLIRGKRVTRRMILDEFRLILTFRDGKLRGVLKEYHGKFHNLATTEYGQSVYDVPIYRVMAMGITVQNYREKMTEMKRAELVLQWSRPIGSPND